MALSGRLDMVTLQMDSVVALSSTEPGIVFDADQKSEDDESDFESEGGSEQDLEQDNVSFRLMLMMHGRMILTRMKMMDLNSSSFPCQ